MLLEIYLAGSFPKWCYLREWQLPSAESDAGLGYWNNSLQIVVTVLSWWKTENFSILYICVKVL